MWKQPRAIDMEIIFIVWYSNRNVLYDPRDGIEGKGGRLRSVGFRARAKSRTLVKRRKRQLYFDLTSIRTYIHTYKLYTHTTTTTTKKNIKQRPSLSLSTLYIMHHIQVALFSYPPCGVSISEIKKSRFFFLLFFSLPSSWIIENGVVKDPPRRNSGRQLKRRKGSFFFLLLSWQRAGLHCIG